MLSIVLITLNYAMPFNLKPFSHFWSWLSISTFTTVCGLLWRNGYYFILKNKTLELSVLLAVSLFEPLHQPICCNQIWALTNMKNCFIFPQSPPNERPHPISFHLQHAKPPFEKQLRLSTVLKPNPCLYYWAIKRLGCHGMRKSDIASLGYWSQHN